VVQDRHQQRRAISAIVPEIILEWMQQSLSSTSNSNPQQCRSVDTIEAEVLVTEALSKPVQA